MHGRSILIVIAAAALIFVTASAAMAGTKVLAVTIAAQGDFVTGVEWSSSGAFTDEGTVGPVRQVFGSPLPPSPQWTAHEDLVFAGTAGTFTLRQQVLLIDVDPSHSLGTIHWVVLGGTGSYAEMHGAGTGAITIDWAAGTIAATNWGEVALP